MTPVYYPLDEYRCGQEITDHRTQHLHLQAHAQVCMVFRHVLPQILRRSNEPPGGSLLGWPVGCRYVCITGPDGRVLRDVLYSDEEVSSAVASLL
jgi:hypothetical protein